MRRVRDHRSAVGGGPGATARPGGSHRPRLPDVAAQPPQAAQLKQHGLAQPAAVAAAQRLRQLVQPLVVGGGGAAAALRLVAPLRPARDGGAQLALAVLQPLVAAQGPGVDIVARPRRRATPAPVPTPRARVSAAPEQRGARRRRGCRLLRAVGRPRGVARGPQAQWEACGAARGRDKRTGCSCCGATGQRSSSPPSRRPRTGPPEAPAALPSPSRAAAAAAVRRGPGAGTGTPSRKPARRALPWRFPASAPAARPTGRRPTRWRRWTAQAAAALAAQPFRRESVLRTCRWPSG